MKRLVVLIAVLGLAAAQAAQAAQADLPAFCKSMCSSEQRQCRADAQLLPKEERMMPDAQGNAFTRGQQPDPSPSMSADARALRADGDNHRRLARTSKCDTAYQRCVRSCDQPGDAGGADRTKRKPITFG